MSDPKRPESDMEPKPTPESAEEVAAPAEEPVLSTLSGPAKQVEAKRYAPQRRGLVIVAAIAAVAVLGGGLFAATRTDWLKKPETSKEPVSEVSAEPPLDPLIDKSALGTDAIDQVEIGAEGETVTLRKNADGLLCVAGFEDLPRSADTINSLLSQLLTITPESLVLSDATEAELQACGLLPPEATVSVTFADGDTFSFDIGNVEPGEHAHFYFRKAGETAVYLVEATLYQALTRPATEYLATVLTPAPSPASDDSAGTPKLERLSLSGTLRDTPVVLRRAEKSDPSSVKIAGNYVVEKPYYRAIDTNLVSPWETGLCDATASSVAAAHPTAEQLAEFGLDEPRSVATITFAIFPTDGSATEPYNRVSYTVSLGGKDENGNYFALVDGLDIVYLVTPTMVPGAEATYNESATSTLFLHYITDVSDITMSVNGTDSVVHLTHAGGESSDTAATFTATVNGRDVTEADTRALYRLMMMVKRVALVDADVQPTGTPILSLRLSFLGAEDADAVYAFYPYSANRYLCVAADGDVFQVKAATLETLLSQIERYVNGESVQE